MKKTVDKTKKSNIKCEHCKHGKEKKAAFRIYGVNVIKTVCSKTGAYKEYWNRCKSFEWREDL